VREGNGSRLDSWKEIAGYVGRDVRTAIRWERERGLPVHRVPGEKRGGVFVFTGEIDRWLLSVAIPADHSGMPEGPATPEPGATRRLAEQERAAEGRRRSVQSRWLAVLAGALVLLPLLGIALRAGIPRKRSGVVPVAAISLTGTELIAHSPGREVLWRHDFGRAVLSREDPAPERMPRTFSGTGDLDGDGLSDLVVSVRFGQETLYASQSRHELFAFSAAGRVLWSRRLEETLTFGAGTFAGPWQTPYGDETGPQVAVFSVAGEKRVAWAQSHCTWWPSILTVLDASGRLLSRWVHSGVIFAVAPMETASGLRLLVGGISNSREAAFLAVLDAAKAEGSGPEEPGSAFECRSCGPGRPLRYFVIQPSEQKLAVGPYNCLTDIRPDERGVEVRTTEHAPGSAVRVEAVARFSAEFKLEHTAWSSAWATGHRQLERAGKLDHPVERCPERDRPPRIREWTLENGWRDVTPVPIAAASTRAQTVDDSR
jgi:hypothetical protein